MAHIVQGTVAERACAVAPLLPHGPFSKARFLDHATGLNLLDNASEVDAILAHLTKTGCIVKLGPNLEMWVAA